MFGAFKPTSSVLGGLLWKSPWRMSAPQKSRVRNRLKDVDEVIKQVTLGLHVQKCQDKGISYEESLKSDTQYKPRSKLLRLLNKSSFFPKESEMLPRDKYTVFNRKSDGYRKSVHKVPKWTKISMRKNPDHF
ncbi:hypothetical protein Kpol_297p5 [Vanderwaltozyma polyspora DSM 70294]|uniref:Large ribosomal subunit protein mL60 n=1 Tax=Vanderwaltozyma polyspora (strain ATCC 22028 / DSM 70294 / BCRC 21397 / CBS 2163 / NBRC 10782 / NRRL Y-8283 / UCD 57-17) TaxID=436907 RepID=A7TSK9_VANPO|nr:uncharacterized protein Kpol_297p5 [Vanderwaltozyma polyspora DSM 70294]EDO14744.1 hypothetical protein Kpol_297p5 [Vanderwaltozyma polyspora DSM 70294]